MESPKSLHYRKFFAENTNEGFFFVFQIFIYISYALMF